MARLPELALLAFMVATPQLAKGMDNGDQGDQQVGDLDDGSLFGADTPPFELGWSHAPIVGVVHFGKPFGVSTSYAAVYGADSLCPKPVNWGGACTGLLTSAEVGLGGGRIGLGAGTVTAGKSHFGVMLSGLRSWSKPAFFETFPIQNFKGVELIAGKDIYHLTLGAYLPLKAIKGISAKSPSFTWSVGAGF